MSDDQTQTEQEESYIDKGDRLIEEGDYDGAIALYTEVISAEPKDGFNFLLRGDAYRKKGELDRAIVDYTRSISLSDDDEDRALAYIYRAVSYIGKSEYHNVIADANEVIKTGHFLDNAYLSRGIAYTRLGPMTQGYNDLKTAADLGNKGALKELEKYGIIYTPDVIKNKRKNKNK